MAVEEADDTALVGGRGGLEPGVWPAPGMRQRSRGGRAAASKNSALMSSPLSLAPASTSITARGEIRPITSRSDGGGTSADSTA